MESLNVKATKSTPEIVFECATGVLAISGESYPENSYEFFKPVLSWISRFTAVNTGPVMLNLRLSYLNTGSTKCMLDILDLLEELFLNGRAVTVNWYYDEENDRALESAEEFKEEVSMPFNIIPMRDGA